MPASPGRRHTHRPGDHRPLRPARVHGRGRGGRCARRRGGGEHGGPATPVVTVNVPAADDVTAPVSMAVTSPSRRGRRDQSPRVEVPAVRGALPRPSSPAPADARPPAEPASQQAPPIFFFFFFFFPPPPLGPARRRDAPRRPPARPRVAPSGPGSRRRFSPPQQLHGRRAPVTTVAAAPVVARVRRPPRRSRWPAGRRGRAAVGASPPARGPPPSSPPSWRPSS